MSNFSISFSYPWLLLLLLPAIALTLIPYFRLSKKFRRTRNRIVSLVTHLCVMVLCVCVLCGIEFRYVKKNTNNEIILLVDASDTSNRAEARRDECVQNVLSDGRYDGYKIGVVTFGFTQNYAVPLTYDVKDIYDMYKKAELPDVSATNIEAALKYTKDLFSRPETSKVVLITDGKETDGNALSAVRSLTAQGTKVDTAYISEDFEGADVQVSDIVLPDTHVKPETDCTLKVVLRSRSATTGTRIVLKDNGTAIKTDGESEKTTELAIGANEVAFTHKFTASGLHEITAQVFSDDSLTANNEYTTYIYLQDFKNVLIVEQESAESEALVQLLSDNDYFVDRADVSKKDVEKLTTTKGYTLETTEDFRRYDQVIMNNVSNSDLTESCLKNFSEILYSYVYDYGGGLFTVGGDKVVTDAGGSVLAAHAYNRKDLKGSKYQEILPVEAIDYKPPVGVVVCVDTSGSMTDLLEQAVSGLQTCYEALDERDYLGILSLDSDYKPILPLTSVARRSAIIEAIKSKDLQQASGNTDFFKTIQRAGEMLQSNKQVEKKQIMIVSDGQANGEADYILEAEKLAKRGISISVVLIGTAEGNVKSNMEALVAPGKGQVLDSSSGNGSLIERMRLALGAKQAEETENTEFYPLVKSPTSAIFNGVGYGITQKGGESGSSGSSGSGDGKEEEKDERDAFRMRVKLGGFYGVKKKDGADVLLTGDYDVAPLYAQWKFGAGTVGSFMSDLTALAKADASPSWSEQFMGDENCRKLVLNIIDNLMPIEDISPAAFSYELTERNYTNTLRIDAGLKDGEYIDARIIFGNNATESVSLNEVSQGGDVYVTVPLGKANQYSRCEFIVKKSGVYRIELVKKNSAGETIEGQTVSAYKSFAYSQEYNLYAEDENPEELLATIARNGNGKKIADITEPKEVFESFVTGINRTYDPRYLFAILSIVLFLTDIAVRKFKFKWLHEIIRDKKQQKSNKKQAA